ncbi:MAG: glycosyltransferase family 9 protein, partial [bacterium]
MSKIQSAIFALKLRRKRYDVSITSYPANRIEYNILSFLVGAKMRIAHRYRHYRYINLPFLNTHTIDQTERLHNVEENLRLLEPLGILYELPERLVFPLHKEEIEWAKEYFISSGLDKNSPIFGFHAFSTTFKNMHRKCWPKENFVELIDKLSLRFQDAGFILFGSKIDEEVNRFIAENTKAKVWIFDNFPIMKTAALIKQCDLFVTNDSGLMHLAAAMGRKTVSLFGPTNPEHLHPWGNKHKIIRAELPCSPCFFYSQKPLQCKLKDNQYLCMKSISVESVLSACVELICEKD